MATITKTPSKTWKALVRKKGWPTRIKTFRTKRDATDWARHMEDEMIRSAHIKQLNIISWLCYEKKVNGIAVVPVVH